MPRLLPPGSKTVDQAAAMMLFSNAIYLDVFHHVKRSFIFRAVAVQNLAVATLACASSRGTTAAAAWARTHAW